MYIRENAGIENTNVNTPYMVDKDAFADVLFLLKGKENKALAYMLDNLMIYDKHELVYIGTKADICKGSSLSRPTVSNLIKKLLNNKVIFQYKGNMWFFNSDIMFYDEDIDKEEKELIERYGDESE